jgi:eukaryotic-like serine/threonine-protein kinase
MNSVSPIVKLALEKKLITEEQCEQCREMIRKSKKIGFETTMEELLVKQGFLLEEQIEELRHISQLGTGDGKYFGHYRLGRMIGEGGMGKVYEATHEFMGRTVAIKVINQELTADRTRALRFFQEIRALIKLDHPNIVTVYDAGRVQRSYYYAMELLPGPSLKDYIDKRKFLPENEALSIIRSIAKALGHAHANSVVHRDVKPENIMFDVLGAPKLTDFGIAMHHDEHHMTLTQEGMMVGSLYYTAPEQVDGNRDIDCRADIYSLGATLYYALTGTTVYHGSTPQELLAKHISGTIVSPRTINRQVSRRAAAIVKKMLAKNRDRRYQSMDEVIAAIERPALAFQMRFVAAAGVAAALFILLGVLLQKYFWLLP